MVTIVSRVRIRSGDVEAWEEAFSERAAAAREQSGFVSVQLAVPLDAPSERVIIGTWESREDWELWHGHEAFLETRRQLEEIDDEKEQDRWHEVLVHERS
jgi:heme-degrading monooxygenase HmoA